MSNGAAECDVCGPEPTLEQAAKVLAEDRAARMAGFQRELEALQAKYRCVVRPIMQIVGD